MGSERVGGGGGVDAVVVVGVQDDLVVAAKRRQGCPWAGEAEGAGDVPGPELPRPDDHEQFDIGVGVEGGLEFVPGNEPGRFGFHRAGPLVLAA
ncbi:MAG: hypothetical protein M3O65_16895 [Actinomycetota bacterium]|nr:hypothetical protein [Actinomycetota bacterium]